ncbi:MAG: fibrillarin-like rRNA/tRNA 2'-O-methyltransferase [Candidatus Aenigmarchaeota archaeon]|nr:fibrillarin-like rRNA/tRNA 2'-O-methyltransferase [Candidatus Aenigmarchaeota archaeon]MDW8149011.1 fibrillarin-like rRNA/tRNA 2'-O-methyltransferase [Candidatus Aenigmarchaeota archaeon]
MQEIFEGIYKIDNQIATINLVPGKKTANEKIIIKNNIEFRIWDPYTSKPAAAIKKGIKNFPLKKNMKILYLGFASGKTATYFSDIIGKEGIIYGVEISWDVLKDSFFACQERKNMLPILADARKPNEYKDFILEKVDVVYEDIASPDMIRILNINSKEFLKENGFAIIAIKSQCIDSTKDPKIVYRECLKELSKDFEILDKIELDPYEIAHMLVILKKK